MQFGTLDDFSKFSLGMDPNQLTVPQIKELSEFVVRDDALPAITASDPLSDEYRLQVVRLYKAITNQDYVVAKHELTPFLDPVASAKSPRLFKQGDGEYLAEYLASHAAIIRAMETKSGQSVIEYGPGEGQLAITLARLGCRVAAVDIEPKFLESIRQQCSKLDLSITTHCGLFGSAPGGFERVDRILFFESFHHALDHLTLLPRLRQRLTENGMIVMAGEPILEPGNYWLPAVPYPWGPRLDGLSVFAMKNYGWCELGFREEYLFDAFRRSGFAITKITNPVTARGNCYVARPDGPTSV